MDLASVAMSQTQKMLQATVSTMILRKAMGADAQSMAILLNDMQAANPAPPVKAGSMDISV